MTTYLHPMQKAVADFHHTFGIPDLIDNPGPLPPERIELRLGLIREKGVVELSEANDEGDSIAIIDALINTIYVTLGALVEMGCEVIRLPRSAKYPRDPMALKTNAEAEAYYISDPLETLESNKQALTDTHLATELLSYICRCAYSTLAYSGINPRPYFNEVHRANMSKLGDDGKPIHSRGILLDGYPTGKVLKEPNYSPPDLKRIFDEQATKYPDRYKAMLPHCSTD